MTIKPLIILPDPILRQVSAPLETINDEARRLADDMLETMYDAPGIGLAAIQIGVPRRMLVLDVSKDGEEKTPLVFINPEIIKTSDTRSVYEEGCLSIPDYYAEVERPATLEDIRAEVLAPERLNAFVFSALGGIALLIAIVGVAGVLAFSVSARTREFGVRLAVGSTPRDLRAGVLLDGLRIAAIGIAAGAAGGYGMVRVAESLFGNVELPGALPVGAAALVLIGAAIGASLMPATRASRVDVLQALRSE